MTLRFPLVLAALLVPSLTFAQSPFAGSYSGHLHIELSGAYSQPPTPAGLMIFNVLADGTISELGGDPIGTVDGSGNITWQQPNTFHFTTGTITGGVVHSTSTTTDNGLTTTLTIAAKLGGTGLPAGETFTRQFIDLAPENGQSGHEAIIHTEHGFIAVGNRGSASLSADGLTWTTSAVPTYRNLKAVAYGNGVYLAGGDNGALFTSSDGIDWTPRNSPFLFSGMSGLVAIDGAAYGAGKFVITSAFGEHAVSSDGGATWTIGASKIGSSSSKIKFLNGKFVQYTTSLVRFSDDAVTWAASVNPGVGTSLRSVIYGGGHWYAGGATGSNTIARSADGVTWTNVLSGSGNNVAALQYGNGRFVAKLVGSGGAILTSADGQTWTNSNEVTGVSGSDIVHGGGRFIITGNSLVASEDGVTWRSLRRATLVPSYVDFMPSNTSGATLFQNQRALVDSEGTTHVIPIHSWRGGSGIGGASNSHYYAGPGGTAYVDRTNLKQKLDTPTDEDLHAVALINDTVPVFGGGNGTILHVRFGSAGSTSEFIDRIDVVDSPTTSTLRYGSDLDASRKYLVGDNGTIVRLQQMGGAVNATLEPSGTSHHLRYVSHVTTRASFQLPGRDIVTGNNGTLLVRNPDTDAWVSHDTGTTDHLIGIAYVSSGNSNNTNGHYVAVGENGTVILSTDLQTWTAGRPIAAPGKLIRFKPHNVSGGLAVGEHGFQARAFATSDGIHFTTNLPPEVPSAGITHGAGKFVVVGGVTAAVSSNGRDWRSSLLPIGGTVPTANAVAYGAGRFVAVGGPQAGALRNRRIAWSADGENWHAVHHDLSGDSLTSVAYGSGRFVAAGSRGHVMTSTNGSDWTVAVDSLVGTGSPSIRSIVHHNGTFVGVGDNLIISSTDGGATWAARSTGATSTTSVTYGNGLFVAVGSGGHVYRSENGTSFVSTLLPVSPPTTGARPAFRSVAFIDGAFLALTSDGRGYTSTDAVAWQEKFTGLPVNFNDNVVANGLAVFVGGGRVIGLAVEDNSPYITQQPQNAALDQGATLTLSASVTGAGPLEYQWLRNGAPLSNGGSVSGATSASLTISNISPGGAGVYQLVVANAHGSRASREATVQVESSGVDPASFAGWAEGYEFPPEEDGPLDDPDKDGVSNLLEYVFGSHPLEPGANHLPSSGIVPAAELGSGADPGKTYFAFHVRVRKERPGITLAPEAGLTLDDFAPSDDISQAGPPADDPDDPAFEIITWYYAVPLEDSTQGRAFLRLAVTLDP